MTYEEKGAWVYGLVAVAVWTGYALVVLRLAAGGPLAAVDYTSPLLRSVAISVVLTAVGRVVVEMVRPSETQKADVRDRDIDRRGEYVGGIVLAVAMVGPFALTLAEADHFWIANAMYLAFVLGAVVASLVKVVVYRRGF
ncbi:conserved hypothetical protein [Cellulomonas flavigena DSM 20109]|uniref:Integral membrane protein n=1 Tax=Cellulomonas flavigena (strain ATCC 482 / DSM 20109 / BCRC 11376 / JCM 18109 / NBRC 3775 / NCIMB 8073 / NRS 134) TaxID=446466 RepID=D5UCJ2_CELFN|nr:hypothetical protein [Cellulomonas flavigena]ADG74306.1 conserved hypothetical protein [Cellulomonas flavigena DSM 20109]